MTATSTSTTMHRYALSDDRWDRVAPLAAAAGLTPARLAAVAGGGFGKGFAESVNGYRVGGVPARLREPGAEALTLLALAPESGCGRTRADAVGEVGVERGTGRPR